MSDPAKTEIHESRLLGDEIRVAIGYRIYELFCADCNRVLIEEDQQLMRLQCKECKRVYAFRLHPEREQYITLSSMGKVIMQ